MVSLNASLCARPDDEACAPCWTSGWLRRAWTPEGLCWAGVDIWQRERHVWSARWLCARQPRMGLGSASLEGQVRAAEEEGSSSVGRTEGRPAVTKASLASPRLPLPLWAAVPQAPALFSQQTPAPVPSPSQNAAGRTG